MSRSGFTNEDFMNLMVVFGECQKIISRTVRAYNEKYPNRLRATRDIVRRLIKNCEQHGQFRAVKRKNCWVVGDEDNVINVLAFFHASPTASIRDAVRGLNIGKGSILKILYSNNWHAFHYQRVQHLQNNDGMRRIEFCEFILTKIQEHPDFLNNIIWADEAKFTRNGCYNRHNSHFWSNANPHMVRRRQFQEKWHFNVFCAIKDRRVLFLRFYEENLNGDNYLNILREMVEVIDDTMPIREALKAWFQQDGAPPHNNRLVDNFLENTFDGKWLGYQGPYKWPPRSPDLTPLDYFIWGFVKDQVYFEPVTTKENMVERVQNAFASLQPHQIQRATHHSLVKRV